MAKHNLFGLGETNRFLHESLLRIWDFFHECEKFRLFTSGALAERVERRWISLTSGRNPRSSIRTSARTCFFCFNLKTKHVDFIHSLACQCHVYYTKYYNATCNAVNTIYSATRQCNNPNICGPLTSIAMTIYSGHSPV